MSMKVLRVKKTSYFDVFSGRGWKNWTRVSFNLTNHNLTHISGLPLAVSARNQLYRYLSERFTKGNTNVQATS